MGKAADIGSIGALGDSAFEGALLLLFPQGRRPDHTALAAAVDATERLIITQPLVDGDNPITGCEVLRDGMTFDIVGLAPSKALHMAPPRHRYGIEDDELLAGSEALAIMPGPHLRTKGGMLPIMRMLAAVVADLAASIPHSTAVAWQPARSVVGLPFFSSSVRTWVTGGAFPSLGLTAFAEDPDGGIRSEGLAWFIGQELRLANDIAKDRAAAVQLGLRLVNQLVAQGRVTETEQVVAPDGGRLALEPSRDGQIVRVRRA